MRKMPGDTERLDNPPGYWIDPADAELRRNIITRFRANYHGIDRPFMDDLADDIRMAFNSVRAGERGKRRPMTKRNDDPKRIWLQPSCGADNCNYERCWSEDNIGPCDECGRPCVEYVRADVVTKMVAECKEQNNAD